MPENCYNSVIALLDQHQCPYRCHEHEAVVSLDEAREKVPHLCENLLKTVVFRIKDGGWVLAAVAGQARIHYKLLADALGIKRTALRAMAPQDVESALGFQIGGVGPFAINPQISVVLDAQIRGQVFCGSGRNTCTIGMAVTDLIRISKARVAPLTRPEQG
ncbi:YbaK/EbsC family protein [Granulosicoccaceae sp. 1_MG-2023]|nr:YbaK/EbsC family protein [Granulosicoccaceae sp. 1_MG-2023]